MRRHQSVATANPPLEKVVQQQIARLFTAAGGFVRSTSQARASRVAPGIPDLMVHFPGTGFVFFECKTYRRPWRPMDPPATWRPNPLAPDQECFRRDCEDSGVLYRWGGLPQAEAVLIELGLAERRKDGGWWSVENPKVPPLRVDTYRCTIKSAGRTTRPAPTNGDQRP